MENDDNYVYVGEILVGTPSQTVDVLFDTTCKYTWIFDCSDRFDCNNYPNAFDGDASSSFAVIDEDVYASVSSDVLYGASGVWSTDKFCITSDSASCTDDQFQFI